MDTEVNLKRPNSDKNDELIQIKDTKRTKIMSLDTRTLKRANSDKRDQLIN